MYDRFQVVPFGGRYYIIECRPTTIGNIAIQRADHRNGGYTDLVEAQTDCRIMNEYRDIPHPEMCLCGQCAYERYALTGERD